MFDLLFGFIANLFPLGSFQSTRIRDAYRTAWNLRAETDEGSDAVLIVAMKRHSVQGAYDPIEDTDLRYLVEAWRQGMPPKKAMKWYRRSRRGRL